MQQHIAKQQMGSQRNNKQFGTSDNFKAGGHSIGQTDGFNRLQNNQSKSPVNRQFSTMHGMMQSDGNDIDDAEEEELIEEDICDNAESPLVNAQVKH